MEAQGTATGRTARTAWRAAALLCAALCGLPAAAQPAQPLQGTVTHVTDGDTVWLRPAAGGRPVALRLQGIDAPERCQPWGPQARRALQTLVLHQPVQADVVAQDRHGRRVGRLRRGGLDVAGQLVLGGHAWSQRFHRHPGPYAAQEQQARAARRGLFAADRPELPREFRKRHGPCRPA